MRGKQSKYFEGKVGIGIYIRIVEKFWLFGLCSCNIVALDTEESVETKRDFFTQVNKLLLIKIPGTVGRKGASAPGL